MRWWYFASHVKPGDEVCLVEIDGACHWATGDELARYRTMGPMARGPGEVHAAEQLAEACFRQDVCLAGLLIATAPAGITLHVDLDDAPTPFARDGIVRIVRAWNAGHRRLAVRSVLSEDGQLFQFSQRCVPRILTTLYPQIGQEKAEAIMYGWSFGDYVGACLMARDFGFAPDPIALAINWDSASG